MPSTKASRPRQDLLVIGTGNQIREDDGVGLLLLNRLRDYFQSKLSCLESYEPDILLAESIAEFRSVLIVDALVTTEDIPFRLIQLSAGESHIPQGGFISHVFDWRVILALSRDLFGGAGQAELLGISASNFGLSEKLSPPCAANAEKAFQFLINYCSSGGNGPP